MGNTEDIVNKSGQCYYVSIGHFCVGIKKHFHLYGYLKTHPLRPADLTPTHNYAVLHTWGYYDLTIVSFTTDTKAITSGPEVQPPPYVTEFSWHYGTVIDSSFDPKDFDRQVIDNPFVGIAYFKLRKEAIIYSRSETVLQPMVAWLKEKILHARKNKSVETVLILPYGWEDLIVILLSKSLKEIKSVILNLRNNLVFNDSFKKLLVNVVHEELPRHVCLATCTTLCARFDLPVDNTQNTTEWIGENCVKPFLEKTKVDDEIETFLSIQVLPGHEEEVKELLTTELFNISFTTGRNDLLFCPKNPLTLRQFLDFYLLCLMHKASLSGSKIVSTETLFSFTDLHFFKTEKQSKVADKSISHQDAFDVPPILQTWVEKKYIQHHQFQGLVSFLSRTKALRRNPFVNDTLLSFFALSDVFEVSLNYANDLIVSLSQELQELLQIRSPDIRLVVPYIKMLSVRLSTNVDEIMKQSELFLILIHQAFIDRFRGLYPAGETFAIPLLTYGGSFQKFLNSIDILGTILCEEIVNLAKTNEEKTLGPETNVPGPVIISFVSSCPAPQIIYLHCPEVHFLGLPISSFFNLKKEIFFILHEIGHCFWNNLNTSLEINIPKDDLLLQVLADYFATCILHNENQPSSYIQTEIEYFKDIASSEAILKSNIVDGMEIAEDRIFLLRWLYEFTERGNIATMKDEKRQIKESILSSEHISKIILYIISQCKEKSVFWKILVLLNSKRIREANMNPEAKEVLEDLRKIFSEPSISPERICEFWQRLYRLAILRMKSTLLTSGY